MENVVGDANAKSKNIVLVVHRGADVAEFRATDQRRWPTGPRTIMVELDRNMPDEERARVKQILGTNYEILVYDQQSGETSYSLRNGRDWWSIVLVAFMVGDLTYYKYGDDISEAYSKVKFYLRLASASYEGYKAFSSKVSSAQSSDNNAKTRFSEVCGKFKIKRN